MTTVRGWAVIDGDGLNVQTVSPHRRGAIVNWLVAKHRIMVMNAATDEEIFVVWRRESQSAAARVVEVAIQTIN